MAFNCIDIWETGMEKLRVYCKKAAIVPKSTRPITAKYPPSIDVAANNKYDKFPIIGISMLANVFAFDA